MRLTPRTERGLHDESGAVGEGPDMPATVREDQVSFTASRVLDIGKGAS